MTIRGETDFRIHTHGGDSAHPDSAKFAVTNSGERPVQVTLERVQLLHGSECGKMPTRVQATLAAKGLGIAGSKSLPSVTSVEIGPRQEVSLVALFSSTPVYYTYCDQFVFRASFRVAGELLEPTSELLVEREEP